MEKNIEMLKYNLKFSKFISLVSFILNVTINWLLQTGYELNWVWGYIILRLCCLERELRQKV